MAKLTISGLGNLDGSYEFDDSRFSMRDFHTIKRIAGVRAGEFSDALSAGDTDLMLAVAVIALERNGIAGAEERLWTADIGQINLELGTEDDAVPPPTEPEESKPSSGDDSTVSSGNPETPPKTTGDPQ